MVPHPSDSLHPKLDGSLIVIWALRRLTKGQNLVADKNTRRIIILLKFV